MRAPRFVVVKLPRGALFICGALLALLAATALLRGGTVPAVAPSEVLRGKRVAIDPGHGGVDPGAVGVRGTLEKDVVLAIAKLLDPLMKRAGAETLLLREDDRELATDPGGYGTRQRRDLSLRAERANAFGADVYISLHANSFPSPKWSGAQVFYEPDNEASRRLAIAIQERLAQTFPGNNRKARPGDYFVLKKAQMPGVVVEVGFLSNPEEERLLGTLAHQRQVAEAILLGVADFFAAGEHGRPGVDGEIEAEEKQAAAPTLLTPGELVLYFPFEEGEGDELALLVARLPVHLEDAPVLERVAYALRRVVDGPPGGGPLLPAAPPGTKVLGVELSGGHLRVDLSREVSERFWGGGKSEELLIRSLVLTAAQFPGVEAVEISVEGERERTLAGHIDLSTPFAAGAAVR